MHDYMDAGGRVPIVGASGAKIRPLEGTHGAIVGICATQEVPLGGAMQKLTISDARAGFVK
jgi:hypothetical protein